MIAPGGPLETAIYGGSMGVGMGTAFLFIRWLTNFIAGRIDKSDERLDKRVDGLMVRLEKQVERLTERVNNLENELEDCRKNHAEERAARMELQALIQGTGDARQTAQLIIAAEKLDDKKGKGEA